MPEGLFFYALKKLISNEVYGGQQAQTERNRVVLR